MSFSSRLSLSLALSFTAGLSAPMIAPAILAKASTGNRFAGSFTQTQTVQAQTIQAAPAFSDVSTDYWAHDYIKGLAESKIISGFPDGTFRPNDPVTRAQFSAILRQAFITNPASAQSFADVPANYWAAQSIGAARSSGFLSGYPGNLFKPAQDIPRTQVLVSLANGLKYPGASADRLAFYRDASEIPTYARSAIAAADAANIEISHQVLNRLYPNDKATRAEVAAFVYQALVNQGKLPPVSTMATEWQRNPVATLPVSVSQVAISNDGQRLVTLSPQLNTLQVWNAQTGKSLWNIDLSHTQFNAIAISADGSRVAAIAQDPPAGTVLNLYVWDAATGNQVFTQQLGTISPDKPGVNSTAQVIFAPSGNTILTKVSTLYSDRGEPANSQIRLLSASSGAIVQSFEGTTNRDIGQIAFSQDGTLLAGANYPLANAEQPIEQVIDVWRVSDGSLVKQLKSTEAPRYSIGGMAFTPSAELRVMVASSRAQGTNFRDTWNIQTGQRTRQNDSFPRNRAGVPIRLSSDGRYYYVNGDPNGGQLLRFSAIAQKYLDEAIDKAANFSSNGNYLAVADGQNVRVFSKSQK